VASGAAPPPRDADPTLPWTLPPSLRVLRLGRIDFIRIAYHSAKAMYPIGYAALRRELVEQAKRAAAQADVDTAQNARLVALEKLLLEKAGGLQTATLKSGK
jgi:hypothetical protein